MAVTDFLLDSNIVIYSGLVTNRGLKDWLDSRRVRVSAISWVEVLGYHKLTLKDKMYFEKFFSNIKVYEISDVILHTAIYLRQQKSMSLGDSIIAATALENHLTLVTANIKDFEHIGGLTLINPL